jgi:hypothetical protein
MTMRPIDYLSRDELIIYGEIKAQVKAAKSIQELKRLTVELEEMLHNSIVRYRKEHGFSENESTGQ